LKKKVTGSAVEEDYEWPKGRSIGYESVVDYYNEEAFVAMNFATLHCKKESIEKMELQEILRRSMCE